MNHHPRHLMKSHCHGFHHEHRHHNEHGAYGKFGGRGHHFKHHGPPMEKGLGRRSGRQHGKFGKCDVFAKPCLPEIHRIGKNANVTEQIQQIVRAFFDDSHHWDGGRRCCSASVNAPDGNVADSGIAEGTKPTEGAAGTGNEASQCQKGCHGRKGFGRRNWTLGPCRFGQGRNIVEGESSTEGKETEGVESQAPLCDAHCHHGRGFRKLRGHCMEQGRSTQEEPSRNKNTEQQAAADQCCKKSHHQGQHVHGYGRRHGSEMHRFRRYGRHGCCIIFVDSSSLTGMTQEVNQEVSRHESTTEAMETTEENQETSKEIENSEVQESAD